jgi:hypothetical protein
MFATIGAASASHTDAICFPTSITVKTKTWNKMHTPWRMAQVEQGLAMKNRHNPMMDTSTLIP